MANPSVRKQKGWRPPRIGPTLSLRQRKRILAWTVAIFFVGYAVTTLFPFYMLFVRTFVSTKNTTELHLWIPPQEDINLDAGIGNLAVHFDLDFVRFKEDMGIPLTAYLPARQTLRQIAAEYDIPEERMIRYFAPFSVFNAKSFGIDVEVMSSTKVISGGATSVGGIIVDTGVNDWSSLEILSALYEKKKEMAFMVKLRKEIFRHFGSCMSPRTAQLQSLGLDILELRLERSFTNCMKLSEHLSDHPDVKMVTYPGMPGSEYYELSKKQFEGVPGTILTFDLSSEDACFAFMNRLKVIRRATNMNDNKSLIIHPWSTIYSEYPESRRLEMGVRDTMLRLSVGIEDITDLIEDLEQALK